VNASSNVSVATSMANPSFLARSALLWGMQANVRVGGDPAASDGVRVQDNVMYEAFDFHQVEVYTK
jgi:hypothetical protein